MPKHVFLTPDSTPEVGIYILKIDRKPGMNPLIFEIEMTATENGDWLMRWVDNSTDLWSNFKSCLTEPNITIRKEIYGYAK